MNNTIESFLAGIIIGIVGVACLLFFTGNTSAITQRNIHQEAVSLGYGRWIVDTNTPTGGIAPLATFQWITNNIPSK